MSVTLTFSDMRKLDKETLIGLVLSMTNSTWNNIPTTYSEELNVWSTEIHAWRMTLSDLETRTIASLPQFVYCGTLRDEKVIDHLVLAYVTWVSEKVVPYSVYIELGQTAHKVVANGQARYFSDVTFADWSQIMENRNIISLIRSGERDAWEDNMDNAVSSNE